jgi:flavin-dependent dehydrogenase
LHARKTWLPVGGAVLVVLGFWIGGKHHAAGFALAAVPIVIWAGLHAAAWLRARRRQP